MLQSAHSRCLIKTVPRCLLYQPFQKSLSICNPTLLLAPLSWQVSNASAKNSFLMLVFPPPIRRGAPASELEMVVVRVASS